MDLVIRRAEPSDFEAFAHHLSDPLVFPGTLQPPHASVEMWRKRMAEMADTDYLLVALADGEFAGLAGLHSAGKSPRRAHAMHLGITVGAKWQGKGVGRRLMQELLELADNWLNVIRIELTVFTENARAIALYQQCGFEIEGTHRAYALRDGRYADTYSMARVRPKPSPV